MDNLFTILVLFGARLYPQRYFMELLRFVTFTLGSLWISHSLENNQDSENTTSQNMDYRFVPRSKLVVLPCTCLYSFRSSTTFWGCSPHSTNFLGPRPHKHIKLLGTPVPPYALGRSLRGIHLNQVGSPFWRYLLNWNSFQKSWKIGLLAWT